VSQRDQIVGQALGLPLTMALYSFIGVAVTSATMIIYGQTIRDVERKRRPETDHAGERGNEEGKELAGFRLARRERRRLRENRPEAAGISIRPPQQHQTERDQQRRFDIQEPADAIDP